MTPERHIDQLIGHLEHLRNELAQAENLLLDQRRRIDTWIAHNDDTPKVTGGGDNTTSVERAVTARLAIDTQLHAHREELDAARLTILNLRRDCQHTLRHQGQAFTLELPPTPRCTATGRDGAIHWQDPTCTNIPSRGPLCDRCAKREYRWRQAAGLPPRRDGLYAGDLDQATR